MVAHRKYRHVVPKTHVIVLSAPGSLSRAPRPSSLTAGPLIKIGMSGHTPGAPVVRTITARSTGTVEKLRAGVWPPREATARSLCRTNIEMPCLSSSSKGAFSLHHCPRSFACGMADRAAQVDMSLLSIVSACAALVACARCNEPYGPGRGLQIRPCEACAGGGPQSAGHGVSGIWAPPAILMALSSVGASGRGWHGCTGGVTVIQTAGRF